MPLKTTEPSAVARRQIGHIYSFFSGVALIQGLPNVFLNEVLVDDSGQQAAVVIGFDDDFAEALFFSESFDLSKPVFRSFHPFSVTVSDHVIGRVLNGFGHPKDELGEIKGEEFPVFRDAPPIIDREPVSTPLSTGVKIIDTTLPLGRGQRELIIGDQKLGKSTLAIDAVLNQKLADPPVICVYVVCGQKERKLRKLISTFSKNNAFLYTVLVAATAADSLAMQYLAPLVGCSIGEFFRDQGKDALVVYDDLSKHARNYRDISLLLKRPPGREAYPGDIFSLHASLLERAARLSKKKGGGSLSALPIIETQEGDITSFIPTNLISITDGQIYLERGLYQKGFLPAVNVGLSISRVGGQAQPKILREVVGGIRLALAQHKQLQKLSQLETVVSQEAQKKIYRGELTLELLKQVKHTNVSPAEQTLLFYAAEEGAFDDIEKEKWAGFEKMTLELARSRYRPLMEKIRKGSFGEIEKKAVQEMIEDLKREYLSEKP